ncbi:MAG: nuclear transport factor 2 family protein [SAR324 cluster bacterium]|nr:nuclear transport factor 2 family protein [SAR324 cluster bacterium]
MRGFTATGKEVEAIREWFTELGKHVAAVNYTAGRDLFDADAVGFGTYMTFADGLDALESQQWRSVWSTIEDFRFNLDALRVGVSGDGRSAFALLTFDSTGIAQDGAKFPRPGRVTVIFGRAEPGREWKAVHTHLSLNHGVPQLSHGQRPEKHRQRPETQ